MTADSTSAELPQANPPAADISAIESPFRLTALLRPLLPLILVASFGLAAWVLHQALANVHLPAIKRYLLALPLTRLSAAVALTAASYVVLIGSDILALRYVQKRVPLRAVALTSFISNAFTNNVGGGGFGALTGASVRFRLYTAAGLNGFEITAVIAFCLATFFVGAALTSGMALTFHPEALAVIERVPPGAIRAIGVIATIVVLIYLILSLGAQRIIPVRAWTIRLPRFELALGQVTLSSVDIVLAGAALYQLMPMSLTVGFPAFLAIYIIALVVGVITHVPGGIGVFEGVIVTLLRGGSTPKVLGALLVYRIVYYLLPLLIAAVSFAASEIYGRRKGAAKIARIVADQLTLLAPQVTAVAVFLAGLMLLVSGVTPALEERLTHMQTFLPLPVLEISHITASITGIGLLILSRSLLRRLNGGYLVTMGLLLLGAIASLLKGYDYEEAIFLACVALVLAPARHAFYRHTVIIDRSFSAEWIAALSVIVIGTVWLGFLSYRNVEYARDLWWQFEFYGNASRFLRASVAVSALIMVYAAVQLLRPASPTPSPPDADGLARLLPLVTQSPDTRASLALIGDKSILLNERNDGFVMYGVHGRSWVAMGDPIGPREARAELAWKFRELCDQHAGYTVFYQVSAENLPLYIDLGLALFKLGDEARVDLSQFTLDKPAFKDLRYSHRRTLRDGGTFEVIPARDVPALLPELKEVSDEWFGERKGAEKGFSIGVFDPDYLSYFPCAIVRRSGRIIAFSNLWIGSGKQEFAVDLMRYRAHQLYGVMDFLFLELIHWGQAHGYRWFNLGLAPLSGLEVRQLSPVWYRAASLLYRFGDQFYSFQGLRKYKEKFAPEWHPKYLACPGGLALGRILLDVTALISSGLPGLTRR